MYFFIEHDNDTDRLRRYPMTALPSQFVSWNPEGEGYSKSNNLDNSYGNHEPKCDPINEIIGYEIYEKEIEQHVGYHSFWKGHGNIFPNFVCCICHFIHPLVIDQVINPLTIEARVIMTVVRGE